MLPSLAHQWHASLVADTRSTFLKCGSCPTRLSNPKDYRHYGMCREKSDGQHPSEPNKRTHQDNHRMTQAEQVVIPRPPPLFSRKQWRGWGSSVTLGNLLCCKCSLLQKVPVLTLNGCRAVSNMPVSLTYCRVLRIAAHGCKRSVRACKAPEERVNCISYLLFIS